MAKSSQETREHVEFPFTDEFLVPREPALDVRIAAATHPGKRRPRNEDHFAVVRRTRRCEMLVSNLPDEQVAYVDDQAWGILVADGIGGARFGDVASQMAIDTMLESAGRATSWVMKYADVESADVRQRITAYINRIQEMFQRQALLDPDKHEMGTTLTAAYLVPPHAILVHIGDSRGYLFRDGNLNQLTRDQTLGQALVDAGAVEPDCSRFGHVLINSLGAGRDDISADVMHVELQAADRLLVCSDGLSDMVDATAMAATLAVGDLQAACDQLVQLALDAGGRDNITVVVGEMVSRNG